MEVYRCVNEGIFATVTVDVEKELWSASRGNTAAETLVIAWQSERVKTSSTKHCELKNANDAPKENKLLG